MISDSGKSPDPTTMDFMLRVSAPSGSGLAQAAIRHVAATHTAAARICPDFLTLLTVTSQLRDAAALGSGRARFRAWLVYFWARWVKDGTMSSDPSAGPDKS